LFLYKLLCLEYYYYQELLFFTPDPGNTSPVKQSEYTKLDIIVVFNRIRITEKQEYLTAFNTRYSLYETLVILFGLSNAPVIFQARINEILYPYLDIFYTTYIDDILVYSNNLTSHKQHVRLVIKALQDASLQLDIKKYEFEIIEITYLGIIVSIDSIRIDPTKIIAITN
jgi:Reverse transcriptase (RNA-dependent DNA polymerase)